MSRLRIAMIAEAMDTGLGELVYLLASGLDRRGHEVHLLHSARRTDAGVLRRLKAETDVHCKAVGMVRAVQWADFAAGLAVRRYLRRNGPFDVVHGHSSKGGALARICGAGLRGVRIYTPHAFYTLSPRLSALQRFAYGAAEFALAKLCSAVACSSALEREHALSLGIAPRRTAVIHNGHTPPDLAEPARGALGFGADPPFVVGFVGRLEHQKAPDILLEAVAQAAAQEPGIRLVMIGDGGMESALKRLAARLGIEDRVAWLGRQPSVRHLASFDMLAMPSRYEGFSLMPLEAMHARLPIVCTRVGGVDEAVVDGVTGLVVDVGDVSAFAAAILTLARNPARRHAMGDAAGRRAQLFTAQRMVCATEQLYADALAGKWPASAAAARPAPVE